MVSRPEKSTAVQIEIHPLTPERWHDLETLFGPNGACAGCWCMWWRLERWTHAPEGKQNKRAFRRVVSSGRPPGLLAYVEGAPVGWCAIAPREEYPRLERSRTLYRVDDQPVWSVSCFFIHRRFRRKGITHVLLEAAVAYAAEHGAHVVEGYPIDPGRDVEKISSGSAFTGLLSVFREAGFVEVARRSPRRPIMRRALTH